MEEIVTAGAQTSGSRWRQLAPTTSVIVLLSGMVVAGHMLPGFDNSVIENGIRNSLHVLAFAIFTAIIFELLHRLSVPVALITTVIVIVIVAGLSEFLQYSVGKRLDLIDGVRDFSGAALALVGRLLWRSSRTAGGEKYALTAPRAVAMVLGLMIIMPLLYWFSVIALAYSKSPTILSFDNWWEKHYFHPINTTISVSATIADWPSAHGNVAELHLSGRGRSGLGISPVVSDWVDYEFLTFIAAMEEGPDTNVTVRINDGEHVNHFSDLFTARVVVSHDPVLFRIPLRDMITEPGLRTMELSNIQEIVIFARDKRAGTVLLLDEIRLE